MPVWFWLNVPACTLFFLATSGIPLWLVLRRPDDEHIPERRPGPRENAQVPSLALVTISGRTGACR